jgi:hypothetical protein
MSGSFNSAGTQLAQPAQAKLEEHRRFLRSMQGSIRIRLSGDAMTFR